jgi:hypothetical protein
LQVAAEFLALATGVFYCQPENDSAVQTHTHERPSETNAGERKCTKLEGKKGKKEKKNTRKTGNMLASNYGNLLSHPLGSNVSTTHTLYPTSVTV